MGDEIFGDKLWGRIVGDELLGTSSGGRITGDGLLETRYPITSRGNSCGIGATIRVEPSVLVYLAIISKTVNNRCYNPYIF